MARKIVKKLSKEQKSLLIGMLLGDGTISSNFVFKLSHSEAQREYLEWKVKLLNEKEVLCEIARISSGEVNEVTLQYANELRKKVS